MTYALLPDALPRLTRAVIELAISGERLPSYDLCAVANSARRYFEPMIQDLCRAGILSGMRGPTGGYVLGRPAEEISVGDLHRVIENYQRSKRLPDYGGAPPPPVLCGIEAKLMAELDAVTIADLMEPLVNQGAGI